MISEKELAKFSYLEAPKIITDKIPGPKVEKAWNEAAKYETPTVPGARTPLIWDEARGATTKDLDGNIFIDLCAGVGVSSTGRIHPQVVEAIRNQAMKLMYAGGLRTTLSLELAKKVSNLMPEGLRGNCFTAFHQSGGAVIESAIKFARAITGKTQIVAFEGAYHGSWNGSVALTTNSYYRQGYGPFIPGVLHMPYAYCYRCFAGLKYPGCQLACAKYLDYKLNTSGTGADNVAAVIIEPMQGEGGYIDPPPGFLSMVKEACNKNGILFIADEIQAGAGRTGKMWAIEHYGVAPDMLAWGKGLGSDVVMAGLTIHADLQNKLRLGSQPNTFAGNALSCAVASVNIDILTDPDNNLIGRAAKVGEEIKNKLIEAAKDSRVIGEVRGKGLFVGVELVKNKETRELVSADKVANIIKKGREQGIVFLPCGRDGNVIRFMPSLVITRAYLNKGLDTVLDILKQNEADLAK